MPDFGGDYHLLGYAEKLGGVELLTGKERCRYKLLNTLLAEEEVTRSLPQPRKSHWWSTRKLRCPKCNGIVNEEKEYFEGYAEWYNVVIYSCPCGYRKVISKYDWDLCY